MIKTGYYAMVKAYVSKGFTPVSISLYKPRWLRIPMWKTVAPTKQLLSSSKSHKITHEEYSRIYIKMLNDNKDTIMSEFEEFRNHNCVFLCYEKPDKFCHRHLLADWLNEQFGEQLITEIDIKSL